MIDPNKLPTAAVYWPNIRNMPYVVTVDELLLSTEQVRVRGLGLINVYQIYDVEKLGDYQLIHEAYRKLLGDYYAFPTLAG